MIMDWKQKMAQLSLKNRNDNSLIFVIYSTLIHNNTKDYMQLTATSICAFIAQSGIAFGLYEIIHADRKTWCSIPRYSVVFLIFSENSDGKSKFRDVIHERTTEKTAPD